MKWHLLLIQATIVVFITISCKQTDHLLNSSPPLVEYLVTILPNRPQEIRLDGYSLVQFKAWPGVQLLILNPEHVSVSPTGWAVSKNGQGTGSFTLDVINCYLKCPVEIVVTISK